MCWEDMHSTVGLPYLQRAWPGLASVCHLYGSGMQAEQCQAIIVQPVTHIHQGVKCLGPLSVQGLARKLNTAKPPMVGKMEYVMHARVPIIKLEHTSGLPPCMSVL